MTDLATQLADKEAIRDLIRGVLVQKEWEQSDKEVAGVLTLVYDHHTSDLAQRLIETQHEQHDVILSSMHVHLDHHNCLEALVLKGPGEAVQRLSQKLISTRGVKYGKLTLATTGQEIWATPLNIAKYDGGGDSGTPDNKGGDGPRTTPAIAGDRVLVFDARFKLHCLQRADGRPVWSKDLVQEFGGKVIQWQNAASALV